MKLFYTNLFFVGVPIIAGLLGFIEPSFWAVAALSPILTGLFQMVVGLCLWIDSGYKNIYLTMYILITALFFFLLIITSWEWIWALPPLLGLYMSVLLYVEVKKEKL